MEMNPKGASSDKGLYSLEADRLSQEARARAISTRDHAVVRLWASRHQAEPATGEASASGPATTRVVDGGTGLRFNFPGLSRFRTISWDEWFEHFDRENLVFIYEEEVADRAYTLSQARGGESGLDREDWLEAERQLGGPLHGPIGRYRIVKAE
jgi:hypothetical protein